MRKRPIPYEIFKEMTEKLGRFPTLEEWLQHSNFKRTTYFESKKVYKSINKIKGGKQQ